MYRPPGQNCSLLFILLL